MDESHRILPATGRWTAVDCSVAFRACLQHYRQTEYRVAVASGVRYLTIWNIAHGIPVQSAHAAAVRKGLWRLTGTPYIFPILVL